MGVQLAIDALDVRADRVGGHDELPGDFGVDRSVASSRSTCISRVLRGSTSAGEGEQPVLVGVFPARAASSLLT